MKCDRLHRRLAFIKSRIHDYDESHWLCPVDLIIWPRFNLDLTSIWPCNLTSISPLPQHHNTITSTCQASNLAITTPYWSLTTYYHLVLLGRYIHKHISHKISHTISLTSPSLTKSLIQSLLPHHLSQNLSYLTISHKISLTSLSHKISHTISLTSPPFLIICLNNTSQSTISILTIFHPPHNSLYLYPPYHCTPFSIYVWIIFTHNPIYNHHTVQAYHKCMLTHIWTTL